MLSNDSLLRFAMNNYDNPAGKTVDVFYEDFNRIIYIKKLLNRLHSGEDVSVRLLLNHFIILFNTFKPAAACAMLFFKIDNDKWGSVKSFLVHINQMPDFIPELMVSGEQIPINTKILQQLEAL